MSSLWADEVIIATERPGDQWGGGQRDRAIAAATGDWVCFMDDDDVFVPKAEEILRRHLCGEASWHLFSMRYDNGRTLVANGVRPGGVGSPMIVVPNAPGLPLWADYEGYMNDYFFALGCKKLLGEPECHDEVIATIRPGQRPPRLPLKDR